MLRPMLRPNSKLQTISPREKRKVPFSLVIGQGELMLERSPNHSRMGTAKYKEQQHGNSYRKQKEYIFI